MLKHSITTHSAEETEAVGESIGKRLKGGEVIELASDLGGGKTTLVRGLARGAGSKDHVFSPTFKLCNIYKSKNLVLYHYDFYRLAECGVMGEELNESMGNNDTVLLVEWADTVKTILPHKRLTVKIIAVEKDIRKISFQLPHDLNYLLEDLC